MMNRPTSNRLFPPINLGKSYTTYGPTLVDQTYHIFDGGGGYYTVKAGAPKLGPEGAVMKAPEKDGWYIMRSGQWHRIKREDIPAEVRTTMLILSLNL